MKTFNLGRIKHYDMGGYRVGIRALFMAPKQLSGFLNAYTVHAPIWHSTKEDADMEFNKYGDRRTACIDLSKFEEGHGL